MNSEAKTKAELEKKVYQLQKQIKDLQKQLSDNPVPPDPKSKNTDPDQEIPFNQSIEKTIVFSISQGILLQDAAGRIITANESARKILGLSKDQLSISKPMEWDWKAIRLDGSPFSWEKYPSTISLRTGKKCHNVIIGLYKPDGKLVWISIDSVPLKKTGTKKPYGVIHFL